ncbi:MAG TPA: RING finger protein [Isosphaeraceae bacterium]|jgi:ssDNA-binding Zn-finger/Zn-ribbon topoisomerase 1|nr:RING finger protein [Isosphaeraceae bacterium]
MSTIVTCECGTKIRLPEGAEGRAFRCPKCKAELLATADAQVQGQTRILAATLARGPEVGATCPICQTMIAGEEAVITCPECEQVHHRECWSEVGGCATYGCKQAPASNKDDNLAQQPLSAWGDTKKCPACGETIKAIALRCRYCGTDFETIDPLSVHDLRDQVERDVASQSVRNSVVVLFVLSLIGCLAPILAIVVPIWVLPKRRLLARAGPFYLVLGYSAIVLSVIYSILILLFWLFNET